MTVSLKHTFQSAKLDSADTTIVQPSNWNEEHQLTLATNKVLGRATAGTGAAEEINIGTALSVSGGTLAVTNVPVANGGTGATTLTGVVKGNGTSPMTAGAVDLTTEVSGTLPVANGGTGAATLTANNVLIGNGTSAVTSVAPGTSGNLLTSNGTAWTSAAPTTGPVLEFTRPFVTQTTTNFTVPSGVTAIRLYACGKGGDTISNGSVIMGGAGGGGFGFGTLAVTPGQVINVTISGGVATVVRSGTTLITANPGSSVTNSGTGGAGGTATINGVLTSGGAFTGGSGGSNVNSGPGGGGSAGSPLGNGFAGGGGGLSAGGGGGGIGGVGGLGLGNTNGAGGGGGAGGAGSAPVAGGSGGGSGGGAGGAANGRIPGAGRVIPFSDPLLAGLTATGAIAGSTNGLMSLTSGPGAGGAGGAAGTNGLATPGGFGGGGGGRASSNSNGVFVGGALGGGGGGDYNSVVASLAGGGAGGIDAVGTLVGGPATVWIYY